MLRPLSVVAVATALLLLSAGPARTQQAPDGGAAKLNPPDPAAVAPSIAGQMFPDAAIGQSVSVSGANLSGRKAVVKLRSGANQDVVPADIRVEDRAVVFVVPEKTSGRHNVYVSVDGGADILAGRLDIVGVAPAVRRVTAISPWSKLLQGRFDFELIGERLTSGTPCTVGDVSGCSLTLEVDDQPMTLARCQAPPPASTPATGTRDNVPASPATVLAMPYPGTAPEATRCDVFANVDQEKVCFTPEEPGTRVCVHGFTTQRDKGARRVRVRTGEGVSATVMVHITRITAQTIKWLSVTFLLIGLGVFLSLGRHVRASPTGNSSTMRLVSWALLDDQTNSYSLSKLQILLWAVIVAYCYVYFFLARVYVQGVFEMPEVPSSFNWLLGVTGGTTVMTSMLSRSRGSNGAGSATPSLADLVSTGGVLAPDRAQFLAWTVIGAIGYLVLVLKQPPEMLTALPDVDTQLLAVMGLSAGVFIGGKAVRLPGPIINELKASFDAATAKLTLTAKGQNLHKDAIVSLDGSPVETTRKPGTPMAGSGVDASLLSGLDIEADGDQWKTGDHVLRLTNIDGQFAERWFAVDVPAITAVTDQAAVADTLTSGTTATPITVKGTNLRTGSTADWLPSGATAATPIESKQVNVSSATDATVTLVVGAAKGTGVLGITSPRGIRASRQITVA